jgi:PAS domain S-box-containing protein
MEHAEDRLVATSLRIAALAAWSSVIGGLLVLAAWYWDWPAIHSLGPARSPVSPDTALAFVALGLSLWCARPDKVRFLRLRLALAWFAPFIAVMTLLQAATGRVLLAVPLLFRSVGANPMVPNTAVAILALGLALLLLDRPARRLVTWSQALALLGGMIGAFACLGYLYGTHMLIGPPQSAVVALPTAIVLIVLALGIVAVRPHAGLMATLLQPQAGGLMLRRLAAPTMLLPPLIGYLALQGQHHHLYDTAFGYALTASIDALVITGLLLHTARGLNQAEVGRLSEQSLRQKLEQLGEATVAISQAIIRSQQVGLSPTMEIHADLDLRAVMRAIIDQARQVAGAEFGAIGIGTDPEMPFDPWVVSGVDAETIRRIGRTPRPVGTLGLVPSDGVVIGTDDVATHPAFRGLPPGHPPVRSVLGVPIRLDGHPVGNLYLGNKQGAREFSLDDQRAIELLVPHLAVALKQAQIRAVITAQRAHIESVLAAAPNAILFIDAATDRILSNAMAADLMGREIDPERGRQQYIDRFRHPDGRPASCEELPSSQALAGKTVIGDEWLIIRSDGSMVPILENAAPILGGDGTTVGCVVILQDIAKRKALERVREEYLSLISHDLRGPLTVIGLQAAALRRSLDPQVLAQAGGIQENVRRLTAMIGDLQETSRLETGHVPVRREAVDIAPLLRRLLHTGLSDADRSHVTLDLSADLPKVALDPSRFERVMLNLVSNAQKYAGDDWRVQISAHPVGGAVAITVADNGPGIPTMDMPYLFDKYYRGRRSGKAEGLGLGLYICRLIIEAHDGQIWAENRPEGGAMIRMRLPTAEAAAPAAA